jgi:hypothetical protein
MIDGVKKKGLRDDLRKNNRKTKSGKKPKRSQQQKKNRKISKNSFQFPPYSLYPFHNMSHPYHL